MQVVLYNGCEMVVAVAVVVLVASPQEKSTHSKIIIGQKSFFAAQPVVGLFSIIFIHLMQTEHIMTKMLSLLSSVYQYTINHKKAALLYRDGASNTNKKNSSIFSLIRMH